MSSFDFAQDDNAGILVSLPEVVKLVEPWRMTKSDFKSYIKKPLTTVLLTNDSKQPMSKSVWHKKLLFWQTLICKTPVALNMKKKNQV